MDRRLAVVLLFAGAFLALASSFPAKRSQYSRETIEESRMMTLDRRNGEVSYQTDEEVTVTLDLTESSDPSTLFTSPSMPSDNDTQELDGRGKRAIVGSDNRFRIHSTRSHPLCAIGELISSGGNGYCTVYMINSHHAVTAAHCVYNATSKRYYTNLDVAIGRTCYQPGVRADVLKVSLYRAYEQSGDKRYDIALLQLDSSQINATCYLGVAYQNPTPVFVSSVCGYPYDKQYWYHSYDCMYCSNGIADRFCLNITGVKVCYDDFIIHTTDTTGGMNGSPLLTNKHPGSSLYISYGVSGGWYTYPNGVRLNRAVAFTPKKVIDVCLWLRANGGVCRFI